MSKETNIAKKIVRLREKIESTKTELNRNEGQLDSFMHELKEQFKVHTIKQAEELLEKMTKQINSLQTKLEKRITKLEKDYDF